MVHVEEAFAESAKLLADVGHADRVQAMTADYRAVRASVQSAPLSRAAR